MTFEHVMLAYPPYEVTSCGRDEEAHYEDSGEDADDCEVSTRRPLYVASSPTTEMAAEAILFCSPPHILCHATCAWAIVLFVRGAYERRGGGNGMVGGDTPHVYHLRYTRGTLPRARDSLHEL